MTTDRFAGLRPALIAVCADLDSLAAVRGTTAADEWRPRVEEKADVVFGILIDFITNQDRPTAKGEVKAVWDGEKLTAEEVLQRCESLSDLGVVLFVGRYLLASRRVIPRNGGNFNRLATLLKL